MTKESTTHSLKQTVAKGMLWGGLSNTVCQLLSLLFGVYLARILRRDIVGNTDALQKFREHDVASVYLLGNGQSLVGKSDGSVARNAYERRLLKKTHSAADARL